MSLRALQHLLGSSIPIVEHNLNTEITPGVPTTDTFFIQMIKSSRAHGFSITGTMDGEDYAIFRVARSKVLESGSSLILNSAELINRDYLNIRL